MYPLYQHIRCPIHKLVSQLKHIQDSDNGVQNNTQQNQTKERLVVLLNELLPKINRYSNGSHNWTTALSSQEKPIQEDHSPINKINQFIEDMQMSQLLASLYKEAVQKDNSNAMCGLLLTRQCDLKPLTKLLNHCVLTYQMHTSSHLL